MKTETTYEAHPYAEIFPFADGPEMDLLAQDIKEVGQQEPIKLYEGKILDGRRRNRACSLAGVEPMFEDFHGTEEQALAYVMSKNLHRRHLTEQQCILAAAKYAKANRGRPKTVREEPISESHESNGNGDGTHEVREVVDEEAATIAQAAEKFGVPVSKVKRGKVMVSKGSAKVNQAFADGKLSLTDAARLSQAPKSVQNEIVQAVESGESRTAKEAMEKAGIEVAPHKTGRAKFDASRFVDTLAKLTRLADECKEVNGRSDEHKAIIAALKDVDKAFLRWQKEIKEAEKEAQKEAD
jgi:ParB-like chromosome segregation protein Spo0J